MCIQFFVRRTSAQNLRPGVLRGNVRGRFVRGFCAPNLCAEFGRRICVHICAGRICAECAAGKCSADICAECAAGNFFSCRRCCAEFFSHRRCARGCFRGWAGEFGSENGRRGGRGGQKGPKRAKNAQNGPKWPKMAKKGGGAQKGPKMAHFVPEWYTSGSGATAFDSTGWQKSPEYALIRIAAGPLFPPGTKVADLPKWQKSPILAPPESRRFRPGWQKSPISPPSESGASSVARSLLEKLSARLSPSSQSLHGRLLTDSRGGRARVAHVTCATVTHAHAPHSLKTPVRVHDSQTPAHTPHEPPAHTPRTPARTPRHRDTTSPLCHTGDTEGALRT